ncbi:hypothetical protein CS369_22265 [Candidatus Symbiopectobacterium sp. 'North America']|uniref:YjfB family protein n=1 Tax=Candidatus Symbiopectobacterium sp. 'North America' TaxID=2794574 RepID=UPI0018CA84BB|nr:YjfB family protein [Candidatus Symbiopectobacterium sp. 'North America']MBG6246750.1 hypothetical protein [Candidatus Symbiopectobacterium sp. 'North America']
MDVSQIAALATSLNDMQTCNEANTLVFKKALDNQASAALGLIGSIPQLPANPAIGRNINTTA